MPASAPPPLTSRASAAATAARSNAPVGREPLDATRSEGNAAAAASTAAARRSATGSGTALTMRAAAEAATSDVAPAREDVVAAVAFWSASVAAAVAASTAFHTSRLSSSSSALASATAEATSRSRVAPNRPPPAETGATGARRRDARAARRHGAARRRGAHHGGALRHRGREVAVDSRVEDVCCSLAMRKPRLHVLPGEVPPPLVASFRSCPQLHFACFDTTLVISLREPATGGARFFS